MKSKEIYIRWIGIPIVAILALLYNADHIASRPFWFQYTVSLIFTAVYWNGACLFIFWFRKKFPDIKQTGRRLLFSALGIILWMTVGGVPIKLVFELSSVKETLTMSHQKQFLPFNFIAALVISITYEAFYFFEQWKEQFMVNEQLKNQQIKTQYEVLQNQMSPHFLFNSLNTLLSIIPEDSSAAISFTEKLSDVYRYILKNKERELVRLEEELLFVKNYLFLLEMRYPDNLRFQFNIDERFYHQTLPPLTLQMLVENVIKHNIVSRTKPLYIDIYTETSDTIVVKNNLQKKNIGDSSTKTGLENIKKRYEILGNKKVNIITSADHFIVTVPLIDLLEEKDLISA